MSNLGKLVVELVAEIRKFQADMGTAATTAEVTGKRISDAMAKVVAADEGAGQRIVDAKAEVVTAFEVTGQRVTEACNQIGKGNETVADVTEAAAQSVGKSGTKMAEVAEAVAAGHSEMAATAVRAAASLGPVGWAAGLAATVMASYGLVTAAAAQENTGLVKSLALTGNQAGVTVGQLHAMASAASETVGTQHQAAQALAVTAGSGKVAGENLQALTVTAMNASRQLGQSIEVTAKNFGDLADEPVKASLKLTESLGYLTEGTYRQIKALEEQGDKSAAAAVAQRAYASALDSAGKKTEASLGSLQRAWRGVGDVAAWAWDKMLNVGREDTLPQKLEKQRAAVAALEEQLARRPTGWATGDITPRLEQARALLEVLQLQARADVRAAESAAASVQWNKKRREVLDQVAEAKEKQLTNMQKLAKATQSYDEQVAKGLMTQAERTVLVAAATEQYADKATGRAKAVSAAEKEAHDAAMERRKWFMQGQAEYEKQLEAERQAIERNAAAAAKAEQANIDAAQKSAEAVDKRLLALKDENAAQVLAAQQGVTLAQAIETITIARLAERQAALMREGDRDSEVLAIQAEIDARRKLRDELGAKAGWDAAKKEAKDLAKDSKQMAADVERELTSSLMRGFESGKGFVATLADTVENTFKTMVLRPVISAVVSPVAGAITGSLGLPGTANAAGGGTGVMGVLGNASSLYNAVTNGVSNSVTAGFSKLMSGDFGPKIGMSYYDGNAYQLTGTGQSVGAAMGYAGSALAGYGLQKAISGGYKTGESGLVDAVTVAASAYFGPLAGAVAGVFNRAFGRKLADTGIDGSFGGEAGFTGQQYEFYKGGWFRSDKTKYSAMDSGMQSAFADQFRAQQVQTGLMAQALGQGTDAIANFTRDVKISFQGLTEAQIAEKLQEQFSISSDALAGLVLGGNDFAKTGETTSQTLARLSTSLTTVNQISDTLGWSLQTVSLAGGNAASTLADKFGGLAEMTAATSSYYDAFYSEAERSATATRQLTTQLSALGVALPENEVAYRRLVDGAMASGNEQLAADLIKLSGSYVAHRRSAADLAASVQQSAEQTERSFRSLMQNIESSVKSVAAAEAEIADLELQSRIDAANAANDAARAMGDAAQTLRDYVRGQTTTPQEQFADVLRRAMQGDATAMQALPSAATAANDAAMASARTATEYAIARAKTLVGVSNAADFAQSRSGLVAVPTGESQMSAALRELAQAVTAMNNDVTNAISFDLVNKLGEIDTSGDAAIQFAELKAAFGPLASEATLNKVFGTLDVNGDGQITLLEAIKGNTGTLGTVFASFASTLASVSGQSAGALQNNSALQSAAQSYAAQNPNATQAQIDAMAAQLLSLSIPLPIPGSSGFLFLNPFTGEIVGNTTGGTATMTNPNTGGQSSAGAVSGGAAGWNAYSYLSKNPDIASHYQLYADQIKAEGKASSLTEFAIWHWNNHGRAEGRAFAQGGVFTNGIVTRPTAFDIGLMGEAGDEAIMPLSRMPNGQLGVAAHSGGRDSNTALVAELRDMNAKLLAELQNLRAETRATAINTGRLEQLTKRVTRNGEAMQTKEVAA